MFWKKSNKEGPDKIALVLSGGGARAAYQVGVLKAVADLSPKEAPNPFPIICGTSAGAINAAALAIYSSQFREAIWRLIHVWGNFHMSQVFRSDFTGMSKSALRWIASTARGASQNRKAHGLLDRTPLHELLAYYLPFENIQQSLEQNNLHALCINASNYSTGNSVSFYQGHEGIEPWVRANRIGIRANIHISHLMASSAIPLLFAPVPLGDDYYGDGTMRQNAPTSPALHLGADKLFIIGVKHEDPYSALQKRMVSPPSLGEIAGHVLDSIFLDNVSMDLERLERINKTFSQIPNRHLPDDSVSMRQVEILFISPSQDLSAMTKKHYELIPNTVKLFMRGVGASKEHGANLISYLLFEKAFCRELISLGYSDTMERKQEVIDFMDINPSEQ
ncbi:MAG TPA: patatin-like phospholipase family protein [Gammaproteobacteria bacterium]|nr:patatin-like phospholipase family protein [Gammaproteobacteria bacterium]